MLGNLSPVAGSRLRAQGRRRAPSLHAPSRARKGPFPPCKWPGRSPSFQYRKRPLGPPGLGGSPPLKPANKSLAMWRESLISAFPSPAREPRAALFPRQQDRMTRAPVRASLRLSWPKPKVRAPGARAPPSRRCAFLRPTHEPELPIHSGIRRLLWQHSDESSNG